MRTRYGCDLLSASVLARRGVTSGEQVKFFLEDDIRFLRNPFLMPGMEDAVERILAAREEGEKVLVFGDADVDGITGTVLLTEYLSSLGLDVSWKIPGGQDPYGLTLKAVEDFAADSGTLIITVDCGISRFNEIKRAAELSVDVIVTDHHEPQDRLPEAFAILNPKLKDSSYPFRGLSGCAVAFKLTQALRFADVSDIYSQPICLLNIRPVNDAWAVEVAKMRNLAVVETLTETIVPGMVGIGQTRLPEFLEFQQILVWDGPLQKRALEKLFGKAADIQMLDIREQIGQEIPPVAGKSLLRVRELSSIAKYCDGEQGELDVFVNLFRSFVWKKEKIPCVEESRDLQFAAIGTVGDIMPLQDENRLIVKGGLKSMIPSGVPSGTGSGGGTEGPRPGIAELLEKTGLAGCHFDARDISWKLCPVINAARRMGCPEKAAMLFFEKDPVLRDKMAAELLALNRKRKQLEEQVWGTAEPMAFRSLPEHDGKLVLAYGAEINRGVTGLVAGRLARRFSVPAVVVSLENGTWTGSVRSARGYDIGALLAQFGDLFIDSGGHQAAGGFSLTEDHWEDFLGRLKEVARLIEFPDGSGDDVLEIDAELPPEYLTPDLLNLVDRLSPYGKDNEELLFLARNLVIREINLVGKTETKHLRMTISGGKYQWPAIFWDALSRLEKREFAKGDTVDVVFGLYREWYRGTGNPQMLVKDIRRSDEKKE